MHKQPRSLLRGKIPKSIVKFIFINSFSFFASLSTHTHTHTHTHIYIYIYIDISNTASRLHQSPTHDSQAAPFRDFFFFFLFGKRKQDSLFHEHTTGRFYFYVKCIKQITVLSSLARKKNKTKEYLAIPLIFSLH